jgi:hypothetical protein
MLSAETAIGAFPVEAAEAAVRIARVCEAKGDAFLPTGVTSQLEGDAGALAVAAVALAKAHPGDRGDRLLHPDGPYGRNALEPSPAGASVCVRFG